MTYDREIFVSVAVKKLSNAFSLKRLPRLHIDKACPRRFSENPLNTDTLAMSLNERALFFSTQ